MLDFPARRGIRRGAYLLPSLFTMGNMVLGFYAIVGAATLGACPTNVASTL